MLRAWFAMLPLKLAKVCPSWRALLTSVIFGTSNGCWTAWVSVSQRYGVSIQCRPPTAAALSSRVRSCSSVHCQIAKSSRRPSGKTDESFARITAALGRRISSTPLVKSIVGGVGGAGGAGAVSSDRRMRNGWSLCHEPGKAWILLITSAPVTS